MKRYHLKYKYDWLPINRAERYKTIALEQNREIINLEEKLKNKEHEIYSKTHQLVEDNEGLKHTVRLLKYWFPLAIYTFCCINAIWNYNVNCLNTFHILITNIILFAISLLVTGVIVDIIIDNLENTKIKWLFWIASLILIPLLISLGSTIEERNPTSEPTPTLEEMYQQGFDEGYEATKKHYAEEIQIAENVKYYSDLRVLYEKLVEDIDSPYED